MSDGVTAGGPADLLERVELELADGSRRWYLLSRPQATGERFPLVIDLHGFGEGATVHAETSGLAGFGRSRGFLVAVPHGTPIGDQTIPQWATTVGENRDVAFIEQLIDHLLANHPVDPHRVFLAGFSNGALLTAVLQAQLSERVAGVALVAGGRLPRARLPAVPVPMIVVHGTEDPIVPISGGPVRADAFRTDADLVATPRSAECGSSATERPEDAEDLRRVAVPPLVDHVGDHARDLGLSLVRGECVGSDVTRYVWSDGDGNEVHLCIIEGGGHHWPGSDAYVGLESILGPACVHVNANELIWAFFRSRPTRRGSARR